LSFGVSPTTPNYGNWALENWDGGLNFWKPWPSSNFGNYKMFISDRGGIGINMKPFTRRLPGRNDDLYKLQVNGRIISNANYIWSDQNLKEDIVPLDSSLILLLKLNPVSYKYKSGIVLGDSSENPIDSLNSDIVKYNTSNIINGNETEVDPTTHFGFIAQDLNNVYPNLVGDIGNYKAVNYTELIPVLVKSIQEQQKQIQDLKAEVDYLRTNNVVLGTTNSKLYQNEPNPFKDITFISYYIDEEVPFTTAIINVRDLNGLLKTTIPLSDKSGIGKIEHNFGNLTNGYYVYSLLIDGVTVDTKLFLINND
jgi:hypothetical protein